MRIKLEKATKAELIEAIKSLPWFDAVDRVEASICWQRQQSLIDRIHAIECELQAKRGPKNLEDHRKWLVLHEEHEQILEQLRKIQEEPL
jgi:hypothetical protein